MNPILLAMLMDKDERDRRKGVKGSGRGRDRDYDQRGRDRAMQGRSQDNRGRDREYDERSRDREMQSGGRGSSQERAYAYKYPEYDSRQGVKGTGRFGIGGSQHYRSRDRAMDERDYQDRERGRDRDFDERDRDYDSRHDYEFNQMDQGSLSKSDIRKWSERLRNADGTRGAMYDMSQVMPIAEQMGIDFRKFNEEDLLMTVNMLYSDYCKTIGNDLQKYVELAKAFLEDKDFDGTGSEKLALYYYCIVLGEE